MRIGSKEIGPGKVYIIAEAGVNHNGDIALAKKLVDAAKKSGAGAIKFQTFTVDEIVTENAAQAAYQKENTGVAESQAAMLRRLALSYDDFRSLKKYADTVGIEFLSTGFSIADVDFLHSLDLPAYKVSSGDLTNTPLLKHLASFERPLLLSTGMATLEEIREAIAMITNAEIILLQCTSEYPCPPEHANLATIETLRKEFNLPVGFSDHTEGIDTSVYAASLGAIVIEKHFTLDRSLPGPDHKASLEPHELTDLVQRVRSTKPGSLSIPENILGNGKKEPTAEELVTKKLVRKGIAARKGIEKGESLSEENIVVARPEGSIAPKEWDTVLGKKASCDIAAGTSLTWEMIA